MKLNDFIGKSASKKNLIMGGLCSGEKNRNRDRMISMNMRILLHKYFQVFLLPLVFTACSNQPFVLPTEAPIPIATFALIPITITPSPLPTQPIIILSVTPTPTNTPFFSTNGQGVDISSKQQEEIKKAIESYFEMRYQALSYPQPDGFQLDNIGKLVSTESDGKTFLDAELVKLALQIKYGELNGSRYVSYKYFLDYSNFNMDAATGLVTVLVVEDNGTTTENSTLLAQMSGLKHIIVLRNEQDQWKIVSDNYNDFLWRTIRKDGESTEDMLNMISTIEALITPKPK